MANMVFDKTMGFCGFMLRYGNGKTVTGYYTPWHVERTSLPKGWHAHDIHDNGDKTVTVFPENTYIMDNGDMDGNLLVKEKIGMKDGIAGCTLLLGLEEEKGKDLPEEFMKKAKIDRDVIYARDDEYELGEVLGIMCMKVPA